jgi:hypothetical protein
MQAYILYWVNLLRSYKQVCFIWYRTLSEADSLRADAQLCDDDDG